MSDPNILPGSQHLHPLRVTTKKRSLEKSPSLRAWLSLLQRPESPSADPYASRLCRHLSSVALSTLQTQGGRCSPSSGPMLISGVHKGEQSLASRSHFVPFSSLANCILLPIHIAQTRQQGASSGREKAVQQDREKEGSTAGTDVVGRSDGDPGWAQTAAEAAPSGASGAVDLGSGHAESF